MTFGAVFDEAGFERGFDAGDAAFVDIGLFLFLGRSLDVEIVEGLAIDDGHAQLFTLSCVDQHTLHFYILSRSTASRRESAHSRKWQHADSRRTVGAVRVRGSALYRAGAIIRARPLMGAHASTADPRHLDGGGQSATRTVTITLVRPGWLPWSYNRCSAGCDGRVRHGFRPKRRRGAICRSSLASGGKFFQS